jgi:hypothetical protein
MKTQSALCARDVKQLLKKEYPTIQFSVRSDNFANGNSVDIGWNLGPTSDEVDKLVSKYQYGHFDGMIDMYEHSNMRDDINQAKFVSCQREYKTDEEIENDKLSWRDPKRRNLYKEEKTLYHIIGRDLCKAMNIEYKGLSETVPPKEFQHMIRGYAFGGNLQALVYQLLNPIRFMDGYHGVRNEKTENGDVITNSFELY